jgi:esterase/lipase superfamily enzyme
MGVHLGLHWGSLKAQLVKKKMPRIFAVIVALVAVYGIVVLFKRKITGYLFMQIPFAFFDFEEPLILFLLDYLAAMILFVWIGNFLGKELKK